MQLRYSMYTRDVFTRAQWVYNVNKHCLVAFGSPDSTLIVFKRKVM